VPFIARYRKEATDSLVEVQITAIRDRLEQLEELDQRREAIIKSLGARNVLTGELGKKLTGAETMTVQEDIYLPLRPKKRTRAQSPGKRVWSRLPIFFSKIKRMLQPIRLRKAHPFFVAERMNHDECARNRMRDLFHANGIIKSKLVAGKEEEGAKFKDYFGWNEPAAKAPSHRILAVRRGQSEGFLYFRIQPPEEEALSIVELLFVCGNSPCFLAVAIFPRSS
jgi:uncharacterized protein